MNIRRPRVFLLMFWLTSSWIVGPLLPSVTAESNQESIQESIVKKTEAGFFLRASAGKASVLVPLLNTKVTMTISGLIARTTVSQQFSNSSDEWAEGVYVFPWTSMTPNALEDSTHETSSPMIDSPSIEVSADEIALQEEIPAELVAVDPLASTESLP